MTVLLLAGTAEARQVAQALSGGAVIASLAGSTRRPKPLGVTTRVGGFGGADGFADFLSSSGITAVLDATHPYAARMPLRTAQICASRGLPYMRLLRAPWVAQPGDLWQEVESLPEVASRLPQGACVFLATGGKTMDCADALHSFTLWLRRVDDAGPPPWPRGGVIHGLPSQDADEERRLLEDHGITHIVAKNSGGTMGYAKLEAARRLALPVYLLKRPAAPVAPTTDRIDEAVAFARAHGA